MNKFGGTGVALITPFKKDFSVDHEALEKVVNHVVEGGVEYLVVLGTTGESATLSKEEKLQVVETVKKANNGRIPLVIGIGGNYTQEIIEQIAHTDFTGIAGILSVSPYYNKPNQEGIYLHYKAIAEAAPVPVILYNVPGRTGSNMTADTSLRLSTLPNIIAVKEASGNFEQCMSIIKDKPETFEVISGDDAISLPLIAAGMTGVISVIANAYPKDFSNMVRHALNGNHDAARTLHYRLLNLMTGIFADGSPGGIKEIMQEMGICTNVVRLPLANVKNEVKEKLLGLAKSY